MELCPIGGTNLNLSPFVLEGNVFDCAAAGTDSIDVFNIQSAA